MAGEFVKVRNGIIAPKGFHYMPNGKLMSDADHIAMFGYIEKTINSFDLNTKDISFLGETKRFAISGDVGSVFSLEIYDDDATSNYYNFKTGTWSTTKSGLYNIELSQNYSVSVTFPQLGFTDACNYNNDPTISHDDDDGAIQAGMSVTGTGIPDDATVSSVTSDTAFELSVSTTGGNIDGGTLRFSKLKTYTINLIAVTIDNIKTKHVSYNEARNGDNSININRSTGSNSSVLTKILYQDVKRHFYLSTITPTFEKPFVTQTDGAVSGANKIITDLILTSSTRSDNVRVGDLVTGTGIAASVHALVVKMDPDGDNNKEVQISVADSIGDDVEVVFTPAMLGITPNDTTTADRYRKEVSTGENFRTNFSITCTAASGRTISVFKTPTTDDLVAKTLITFGAAASAILEEDTSSASLFHRWPINNIAGLSEGMELDPAKSGTGQNTTTPAFISSYAPTTTGSKVNNRKYYTDIEDQTTVDFVIPGVDPNGNAVTSVDRNGRTTAQAGNIAFDVQQLDALKADAGVRIYAHGKKHIQTMTGMDVELTNVVITPTQVSTTCASGVSSSTTIGVTELAGISTASTIRGIGIDSSVANPTVTLKSVATGEGNVIASAAQTLESGQTLFFDNASKEITITGTISVNNMALTSQTLYLDVERFLNSI